MLDDPVKIEAAEASINAFIEKRAKQSAAEREREANRLAWLDYHQGQAQRLRATMAALVAKHEAAAERLQHEFQEKGA